MRTILNFPTKDSPLVYFQGHDDTDPVVAIFLPVLPRGPHFLVHLAKLSSQQYTQIQVVRDFHEKIQ